MNFNQWKGHAAKGSVAKVTYVCGDQSALIELVIKDIKEILAVPATDYINLDAGQHQSVWEQASLYPLDPSSNRLIVVRNAEKIEDWSSLAAWLANSKINPNNHLLFVSNQADAPVLWSKGKKTGYQDYIELIRTKGKFIRCSMPNDEDLVSWAQTYRLTKSVAEHLVERTSGDTALMLNVLRKVHIWNSSPNTKVIDLLCEEQALDSFADYLILRDKKTAYIALQTMSDDDRAKIVSRLDYRLDMLTEIGKYVRKRMYAGDIAATTGIKVYLIKRFAPVVKDYDERKIRYCRQVLALVDGAVNDGVKIGAYEALITLW
jgi:DNA polymerase III delta subunit